MSDETYCYPPDYIVLKNIAGIRDTDTLEQFERRMVFQRLLEDVPHGNFDLSHLKSIHHHLFQDVYEWAGQIRTLEISKGHSQFQLAKYVETGMADVHKRLDKSNFLKYLSVTEFSVQAGEIIGDINYAHPFREGNGRTQMQYLKQLCEQAGHPIDLTKIEKEAWLNASRHSFNSNYSPMAECIQHAIEFEPILGRQEQDLDIEPEQ